MKYIDRMGNVTVEENGQDKLLRHLYNDRGGRLCLRVLVSPWDCLLYTSDAADDSVLV